MENLHEKKNRDYAKGGPPLGNFERVSKLTGMYRYIDWSKPEGVALMYLLKQLDAYLWMKNQKHESVTGEGVLERLFDIGVYTGIIHAIESDLRNAPRATNPLADKVVPYVGG